MRDNILQLETGQKLRVLLLKPNILYEPLQLYYDYNLKKYFISNNIKLRVFNNEHLTRIIRYHTLVEYNGELKIIQFGRKIEQKLNELVNELDLKYVDILKHNITLHVNMKKVHHFPDYDDCYFTIQHTDPIDNYFETAEYLKIINSYNKYINDTKLENNPFIIEYLHTMKLIDDKCPLIRLLKFKKLIN